MFLGITVIGWVLIVLVYVPLAGAVMWLLAKWLRPVGRAKWPVLAGVGLALAALPVADSVWLDWKFGQLCKGAGLKVNRVVETDGFFDESDYGYRGPDFLRRRGLRYLEWKDKHGIWRLERSVEEFSKISISQPSARYRYTSTPHKSIGYMLEQKEERVTDTLTNEVTARSIWYFRYPSFVDRLWWRYLDHQPTICGDNSVGLYDAAIVGTYKPLEDK